MTILLLRLSRDRLQPADDAVARQPGPADKEDRVVSPDGAEYVRPPLSIERRRDWLRSPGNGSQDYQLADAVYSQKKLRQQSLEGGPALFYVPVRYGVSRAFRRRNTSETELPQIARQGCLRDIPSTVEQQLSKVLLAADRALFHYLENRGLPLSLVRHCETLPRCGRRREVQSAGIDPDFQIE